MQSQIHSIEAHLPTGFNNLEKMKALSILVSHATLWQDYLDLFRAVLGHNLQPD